MLKRKTMNQLVWLLAVAVAMFCNSPLVWSQVRTWTDSTGKFKIKAELVSQEGETINLKKAGGKAVQLPIDRLSKRDQQFVEQLLLQRKNDAEPDIKLPTDIVALAELAASDSYYDHIPSYLRTTASLSQLQNEITQSSNSELSSAATAVSYTHLTLPTIYSV